MNKARNGEEAKFVLRTSTPLSEEEQEKLIELNGLLLYESGIVATIEVRPNDNAMIHQLEAIAKFDSVLEIQ